MEYAINPAKTPLIDERGFMKPEWYRFLVQNKAQGDGVTAAGVITTGDNQEAFPNSRQLAVETGELTLTDAAPDLTLGLADAGTAGDYGSDSQTIKVSVDDKGRVTAVVEFELNTDNITEGLTNLFFTVARARAAISGTAPISYNSATGAISLAASGVVAGTYAPPTSVTVDEFGRITAIS